MPLVRSMPGPVRWDCDDTPICEATMKLIHTADWQLGKPYGRFEPEVRAALVSPETPDAFAASSSVPGLARLTARVGPLARRDQASAGPRAV